MTHRFQLLSALLVGTALLTSGCSALAPITPQEAQIKTDLATDRFLPATRQMRDAIETQELFAQAAFWSNEYELNPGDLESAIKLASAVRKLGNPGRAVEITRTTRALYPRDPYLIAEYAAALIASERSNEALPILNQGLQTTPSYGRLWSLKGAALDQQERYAEARQHYNRALRITPNDPNVMANIGLSHALSGDATTAEGWLRRAVAAPNASESVRQNLILVLQLQGKTDEADKLRSLSRPNPQIPTLRPAFNPAAVDQTQQQASRPTQFKSPQSNFAPTQGFQGPQARLQTGNAQGQSFTSASEAARAMALKRSQQTTRQPNPQAFAPQQQQVNAVTPKAGFPQQAYPQPNYEQQNPALGTNAPQRRSPNRRRR